MIADHPRNLGRVGKIETLPIFPICRRPSQTVGRGCPRFRVFISRQNLGRSGNSEIPDRPGFSRHMKTSLYDEQMFSNYDFSHHVSGLNVHI